jgi:hypothetical protein
MTTQVVIPILQIILDEGIKWWKSTKVKPKEEAAKAAKKSITLTRKLEGDLDAAALIGVKAASVDQLMVKGLIGKGLADDIHTYVHSNPVASFEQLAGEAGGVPYIGPKRLQALRENMIALGRSQLESEIARDEDAINRESHHLVDATAAGLTALVDGFLGQENYLEPVDRKWVDGEFSAEDYGTLAIDSTALVISKLGYLLPIIFPAFFDPAALAGIVVGAVVSAGLAAIPVVGDAIDLFDEAMGFVADVQNLADLTETLVRGPWIHQFKPVGELQRTGLKNVSPLYQVVIPRHLKDVLSSAIVPSYTATVVIGANPSTTSSYTVAPATSVSDSFVAVFNLSQLEELHLGASGSGAIYDASLDPDGAVRYAVLDSKLPVGEGPVTFADAPDIGQAVRIEAEGKGFATGTLGPGPPGIPLVGLKSMTGRVHDVIELEGGAVGLTIDVTSSTLDSATEYVGGLVYDDGGPHDGELVGLVQVQAGGRLTALTGIGALYLFCIAQPALCT